MKIAKIMDNKLQCPGIWRGLPEVYKKIPTKDMGKLICAGDYDTQLCSVNYYFPSLIPSPALYGELLVLVRSLKQVLTLIRGYF